MVPRTDDPSMSKEQRTATDREKGATLIEPGAFAGSEGGQSLYMKYRVHWVTTLGIQAVLMNERIRASW